MKLALRSLWEALRIRNVLGVHNTSRICPAFPGHEMGVVCCHRCGLLNPSYPHMHWGASDV